MIENMITSAKLVGIISIVLLSVLIFLGVIDYLDRKLNGIFFYSALVLWVWIVITLIMTIFI